ncbi:S26 family signal peptidase [Nonomuraea sp. NPDC003707]
MLLLVLGVGIAMLLRAFVVGSFYIPSESMESTLLVKDRVLVNKLAGKPERGGIRAITRGICTLRACRPLRAFVQTTSETDIRPENLGRGVGFRDGFRDGRESHPVEGTDQEMAEPNMDRVHARLTAALLRMTPPDVAAPFFESDAWTSLTSDQQAMIIDADADADADMEEKDRRRRQQARQERAERRSTRD